MYITGQIEILDTGGVFETLEMTGNEKFEITITVYEDDGVEKSKDLVFDIFNISSVPTDNPKFNMYKFTLAEEGLNRLSDRRYSKSYKDESVSSILEDILKNQLGIDRYDIESTTNKIDFISPYWAPITSLRYLLRLAKGTKGSGFIFFSNLKGEDNHEVQKNIVSLESLLAEPSKQGDSDIYYLKMYHISPHYKNLIIDYKNVSLGSKREQRKNFNGKTYLGVDFHKNKEILTSSKTLDDFISKSTFLGEATNVEKNKNEVLSEVTFRGYQTKDLLDVESDYWFRMGSEKLNVREILCSGNFGRWAGKVIHIEEATDVTSDISSTHIQLTGNWLIKKIVHVIQGDLSYSQKITLIKDSFQEMSNKTDFKSITKKNI